MYFLILFLYVLLSEANPECKNDAACDFNQLCFRPEPGLASCGGFKCNECLHRTRQGDRTRDPGNCLTYKCASKLNQCRPSTCGAVRDRPESCINFTRNNDCICALDTDCPHPDPCVRGRCDFTRGPDQYAGCVFENCSQLGLICSTGKGCIADQGCKATQGCDQSCEGDHECPLSQFCQNKTCDYLRCFDGREDVCRARINDSLRDPGGCLIYRCNVAPLGRCTPSVCTEFASLCRGEPGGGDNECRSCKENIECPELSPSGNPCLQGFCNSLGRCDFRSITSTEQCKPGSGGDDGSGDGGNDTEWWIWIFIVIVIFFILLALFFSSKKSAQEQRRRF